MVLFQTKLIQESPRSNRGSFSNKTDSRNSEINSWLFFEIYTISPVQQQVVVFLKKRLRKFRDQFVVLFQTKLIQEIPRSICGSFSNKTDSRISTFQSLLITGEIEMKILSQARNSENESKTQFLLMINGCVWRLRKNILLRM